MRFQFSSRSWDHYIRMKHFLCEMPTAQKDICSQENLNYPHRSVQRQIRVKSFIKVPLIHLTTRIVPKLHLLSAVKLITANLVRREQLMANLAQIFCRPISHRLLYQRKSFLLIKCNFTFSYTERIFNGVGLKALNIFLSFAI